MRATAAAGRAGACGGDGQGGSVQRQRRRWAGRGHAAAAQVMGRAVAAAQMGNVVGKRTRVGKFQIVGVPDREETDSFLFCFFFGRGNEYDERLIIGTPRIVG